jgi:hypothetical protein
MFHSWDDLKKMESGACFFNTQCAACRNKIIDSQKEISIFTRMYNQCDCFAPSPGYRGRSGWGRCLRMRHYYFNDQVSDKFEVALISPPPSQPSPTSGGRSKFNSELNPPADSPAPSSTPSCSAHSNTPSPTQSQYPYPNPHHSQCGHLSTIAPSLHLANRCLR